MVTHMPSTLNPASQLLLDDMDKEGNMYKRKDDDVSELVLDIRALSALMVC